MISPLTTASVSRRDLEQHRFTWLATGGMVLFMGVASLVLAVIASTDAPLRLVGVGVAAILVAGVLLHSEPPALHRPRNHAVIAMTYILSAFVFWAFQPGGAAAIGGVMFVGPLASVRLVDRFHIGAHLVAATLLFLALCASQVVDLTSTFCILVAIPAMWVLAGACTVVLEAAEAQGVELERLVRRDPLTGVGNRRLLDERLSEELARHSRLGRHLSVMLLDLNGFKVLNDTAGHAAGDQMLRDVANALESITRPEQIVVRQGGDEFFILLPETSPKEAIPTANAVRAVLARIGDGISTGIGVASFPEDAIRADVLLHVADERLMADKEHGPARGAAPAAEPTPATPSLLKISA